MAAQAFDARQSWFLTNGATQGNHALCLALAPPGSRVVVQRNSHASVVDGLVLSGGLPSFVVPEIDPELGITHCVTPEALDAALAGARRMRGRRSSSPRPTTGWPPTSRRSAEVAHAPRRGVRRRPGLGTALRLPRALPRTALDQGADAMLTSTHKIAGSLTQSAMLHVVRQRAGRSGRDRARSAPAARRQPVLAAAGLARRRAPAAGAARRAAAPRDARGDRGRPCEAAETIDGHPAGGRVDGRADGDRRPTTRCGSCSTSAGRAATGYQVADELRRAYDVHVELPEQATVVLSSACVIPPPSCGGWRATSRRSSTGSGARRRPTR